MLPLGARVQDKLEKLLDKHMQSLGVSLALAAMDRPLLILRRCFKAVALYNKQRGNMGEEWPTRESLI
jgi:hypothetical protein